MFSQKGGLVRIVNLILTPGITIAVINLVKYCVRKFTEYKELKLLVTSGKKRVTVTKNGISYEK